MSPPEKSPDKSSKGRPRRIHPDRPSTGAERGELAVQALKQKGGARITVTLHSRTHTSAWHAILNQYAIKPKQFDWVILAWALDGHLIDAKAPEVGHAIEDAVNQLGAEHTLAKRLLAHLSNPTR